MTMNESTADLIRWFFTGEDSRYELGEIVRMAATSRDNIQNWVRRDMVKPDEVTPGRRVYRPLTVADIKVATILVEMNVSPTMAFMAARVVNVETMSWCAPEWFGFWKEGDPAPSFSRDVSDRFAVISWVPVAEKDNPRRMCCDIIGGHEVGGYLTERSAATHTVIPVGRCWIDLAAHGQSLKARPSQKRQAEGDE